MLQKSSDLELNVGKFRVGLQDCRFLSCVQEVTVLSTNLVSVFQHSCVVLCEILLQLKL